MQAEASPGSRNLRRALTHSALALAVCAAMALRSAALWSAARELDPRAYLTGPREEYLWVGAWFSMWTLLTPLIFHLGRRVRIRRGRWLAPLAFHLVTGVAITVSAGTLLSLVFGGLVLGRGWPDGLQDLARPFWTQMALVRALNDTAWYFVILAAGTLFAVYDDHQAKRLQAADLERSLAAAQVDALKMKLQPHFLFNTLNSIVFMAVERDSAAIITMVERLGQLLRASTQTSGAQFITVEEELALLDHYLAIEEVRFRDRLRIVRRVDPAVAGGRVPSLMLQPIIENSIKHGFSRRLDASLLEIRITRDANQLVTVVTDDGPGLPAGWDPARSFGRGLRNVAERLEVLCPGQWSLALKNAEPRGTVVELRIPWSSSSRNVHGAAAG
jgi:two-component system LytT family sensor kinase